MLKHRVSKSMKSVLCTKMKLYHIGQQHKERITQCAQQVSTTYQTILKTRTSSVFLSLEIAIFFHISLRSIQQQAIHKAQSFVINHNDVIESDSPVTKDGVLSPFRGKNHDRYFALPQEVNANTVRHALPYTTELREKIYRELVIPGSVRFLESSKAIHSEAIDMVSQEGVCRLEFNIFKPHSIFPVHDSTRPILNLEIRLNFIDVNPNAPQEENSCTQVFNDWLSRFIGCADTPLGFQPPAHVVPQKSCKILLDCSPGFWQFGLLPTHTFDMIQRLTGFETLVLVFANDYKAETRQRMIERMYAPKPDPRRDMASAMHGRENCATYRMYSDVSEILEATLGPAYFVWDRNGMSLRFYPRDKNADKTEES